MNTQNATQEAPAQNGVKKVTTKSGIIVSRVFKSEWQKEGTLTAELKQTVKTVALYPAKSVANNMHDNIFGTEDFDFETKDFVNEETRVAWIDVPMGSTEESVAAKLESFPNATLYKVLSNKPILTDSQVYGINAKLTTADIIGNRQVVRYSEKDALNAGKLVLDNNGKVQYRAIFFRAAGSEDIDQRTEDPADFYASKEVIAEMTKAGQRVI